MEYTYESFRNGSNLNFKNIESEESRTYVYENGTELTIDKPVALNVSKSGGHRVFDSSGTSHYVRNGWIAIRWTVKEGKPHFVT